MVVMHDTPWCTPHCREKLMELPSPPQVFDARDSSRDPAVTKYLDQHTPAIVNLVLKIGAQV